MKVVIFGSRPPLHLRHNPTLRAEWNEARLGFVALMIKESGLPITKVICGMAHGYDTVAEMWARHKGIPILEFPARWRTGTGDYNPRAGFERNAEMAAIADAGIAFWDGKSKGTKQMIGLLQNKNVPVCVYKVDE